MIIDEIVDSFKNQTRPNIRWKMVGDMYKRIDYIQSTFRGIKTITEFGPFEGCSTSAWISLRPEKFVTVDRGITLDVDLYKQAAGRSSTEEKSTRGGTPAARARWSIPSGSPPQQETPHAWPDRRPPKCHTLQSLEPPPLVPRRRCHFDFQGMS